MITRAAVAGRMRAGQARASEARGRGAGTIGVWSSNARGVRRVARNQVREAGV